MTNCEGVPARVVPVPRVRGGEARASRSRRASGRTCRCRAAVTRRSRQGAEGPWWTASACADFRAPT